MTLLLAVPKIKKLKYGKEILLMTNGGIKRLHLIPQSGKLVGARLVTCWQYQGVIIRSKYLKRIPQGNGSQYQELMKRAYLRTYEDSLQA